MVVRVEKTWESWETAFLIQNATKMPLEEICSRLDRSPQSVKVKATRLRSYGKNVGQLRKCGTFPVQCPVCGEYRYLIAQGGTCRICAKIRRLDGIEARISEVSHLIPTESRRNRHTETKPFSITPKRPEENALDWEERTSKEIDRRANARQKTLERIRNDLGL